MEQQELLKRPLWFYIKAHPLSFSGGIFSLVITNLVDAATPLLIMKAIDQLVAKAPWPEFMQTIYLILGIHVVLSITRYLWRTLFSRFHTFGAEDLRGRIFNNFSNLGPTFFNKNSTGELMSLITNDVNSVRNAIGSGLLMLLDSIILCSIIIPTMFFLNKDWAWKVLIIMPLVPFLFWKVVQWIHKAYKYQQECLSELSGISQEIVSGIRVIKSYAQENNFLKQYNVFNAKMLGANNNLAKVDGLFTPTWQFAVSAGTVILLFIAADDVIAGAATLGTFVAFQRYITKLVWPMSAMGMSLTNFQKGKASFERIKENLTTQTDIPDTGLEVLSNFESLEVKNLYFGYSEKQSSLKNINFKIFAGETVGIVGPVGSGKSTLLNLITRLYPSPVGSILINQKDIADFTLHTLHEKIVYVPQEPFLFSNSIEENLKISDKKNKLNLEDLQKATDAVDIRSEVENLKEGFQSQLGEKGINLSGGQKQRLTIARGILANGDVLILDDSLSAVDVQTERKIQNKLNEHQLTKIISTHRLSSIVNADRIIVMNNGEIESIGKHSELMKKSPIYRNLANLQGHSNEIHE